MLYYAARTSLPIDSYARCAGDYVRRIVTFLIVALVLPISNVSGDAIPFDFFMDEEVIVHPNETVEFRISWHNIVGYDRHFLIELNNSHQNLTVEGLPDDWTQVESGRLGETKLNLTVLENSEYETISLELLITCLEVPEWSLVKNVNVLVSKWSNLNFGANDGVRVKAGAAGDNPVAAYASWTGGSAGAIDTYEATVRGGVLRHDETNYSTGYLPVGPNYSAGRSGAQYYQVMLQQANISEFNIVVTGSYGGCWVSIPDNSGWTTGLSNTNGWANMFTAYGGSGVPRNAAPGCAVGTVMSGSSGTFTCTFGTESTSNASSPYRILIRWRLDAGDSITAMSYTA